MVTNSNKPTQVASMVITKYNGTYQSTISVKGMKLELYNNDRGELLKESSKTIMELLK